MTDATILIPTYRHAALLPYAVRSALVQQRVEVEVFVVGDGVEDDTREALEPFLDDPRVRFFDFPKGERHGEAHRHEALAEARGGIVCYLSDDDLLLGDHVAEMARLLGRADLAHSASFSVLLDGSLSYIPIDLASSRYREKLLRGRWNAIGLTGAAHTFAAYRRLPHGWCPAPADTPTDLHMWRQFLALPGFAGASATRLTHLQFPSPLRASLDTEARVAELDRWSLRSAADGFRLDLERLTTAAAMTAAVAAADDNARLRAHLSAVYGSKWWRLGSPIRRVRALRSQQPRAR